MTIAMEGVRLRVPPPGPIDQETSPYLFFRKTEITIFERSQSDVFVALSPQLTANDVSSPCTPAEVAFQP